MSYPIVNLPRPYPIQYGFKLYDYVLSTKPKVIVEFGCSWGFNTIYMAKALKENGEGTIWTCDNDMSRISQVGNNLKRYGVEDIVDVNLMSYSDWLKNPYEFDLCYIDIHNHGDKLQDIFDDEFFKSQIESGKKVLFEGGCKHRSEVAVERGMSSFDNIKYKYKLLFGTESDKHVIGELDV